MNLYCSIPKGVSGLYLHTFGDKELHLIVSSFHSGQLCYQKGSEHKPWLGHRKIFLYSLFFPHSHLHDSTLGFQNLLCLKLSSIVQPEPLLGTRDMEIDGVCFGF